MRSEVLKGLRDQVPAIVLDIPLLLEAPQKMSLDLIVVVYCPKTLQIKRIRERNGLTLKEAKQRLQNQMPISQKRKMAHVVINNRGSLEETQKQVRGLWERVTKKTGRDSTRPVKK
jgi:dephospho-CoA kinase